MAKGESLRGTELIEELRIADALKGKNIILHPQESSGLDRRSTDTNTRLQTFGVQATAEKSK